MMRSPTQDPYDEVVGVGVLVCRAPVVHEGQGFGVHSGLLYKLDDGEPRVSHLAWHHMLQDDVPPAMALWQQIDLDETNCRIIASWLGSRRDRPENIPYGFRYDGSPYDDEGAFIYPPIGEGLTCATFVVAVLKHLGFPILQEGTWPRARSDDVAWQKGIASILQKTNATQAHVSAVIGDIGAIRIRPNEAVAAACVAPSEWPATYDEVEILAAEIIRQVGSCFKQ